MNSCTIKSRFVLLVNKVGHLLSNLCRNLDKMLYKSYWNHEQVTCHTWFKFSSQSIVKQTYFYTAQVLRRFSIWRSIKIYYDFLYHLRMSYLVVGLPNSHSPFLPDKDYMDYRIVKLTTFQFGKIAWSACFAGYLYWKSDFADLTKKSFGGQHHLWGHLATGMSQKLHLETFNIIFISRQNFFKGLIFYWDAVD